MTCIALIPARGGSKRIPRKNIRAFAGRPMLQYAIDAARSTRLFDRIIVSSDDPEIIEFARHLGAEVPFVRPADLSDDHTPLLPVIQHALTTLESMGYRPDTLCSILPTNPFLQPKDLTAAYKLLAGEHSGFVFPVTTFPSPIQRALQRTNSGHMYPMHPEFRWYRSQDLPEAYHDVGQFYFGTRDAWFAGRGAHDGGKGLPVPSWRVQDIDTEEDWIRAEAMLAALQKLGSLETSHLAEISN